MSMKIEHKISSLDSQMRKLQFQRERHPILVPRSQEKVKIQLYSYAVKIRL